MKKLILITACLALAAASASAAGQFVIGPGIAYSRLTFETGTDWTFTSASLCISSFQGEALGLYTLEQFGFIFSAQSGGTSFNMDDYSMSFSVDCIFGLGYRMLLGEAFTLIAGGGLFFGTAVMIPEDYMDEMFGGYMPIGAGAGVTAGFDIFEGFSVCAQVGAAYSFFSPMSMSPLADFSNGLHVFGGAGIGISY